MVSNKDKAAKTTDKQKRLGEALRANLRRRKDQSRGRKQKAPDSQQTSAKRQS